MGTSLMHRVGANTAKAPFVVLTDKDKPKVKPPAIVMLNPKFTVNIAQMIRNCACFGIEWLIVTGERIQIPSGQKGDRLPRQERMRDYRTVRVLQSDFPSVYFPDAHIIGVELTPGAMPLPYLQHPPAGVYVLGPEDGSISKGWRALCHNIVRIPSLHCLNVAQAGGIVLHHRMESLWRQGKNPLLTLDEDRG